MRGDECCENLRSVSRALAEKQARPRTHLTGLSNITHFEEAYAEHFSCVCMLWLALQDPPRELGRKLVVALSKQLLDLFQQGIGRWLGLC
jgi:hypothetical protein